MGTGGGLDRWVRRKRWLQGTLGRWVAPVRPLNNHPDHVIALARIGEERYRSFQAQERVGGEDIDS